MTSVERIHQYSTLDQEAAEYTDVKPPKNWPMAGAIQLRDLTLTYKDCDTPALGPISLDIKASERASISIVFVSLLYYIYRKYQGNI